jgi:hypothetical protein
MIPSPTAVIRLKTSSTLSTRDRRTVDAPSRHSTAARRTGRRGTGGGRSASTSRRRLGRRPDQLHQQRGQQERRRVDHDDRAEPTGGRDDPAHRAADEPGDVADLPVQGVAVIRPSPGTISGSIAESAVATNTSSTALAASTA